MVKTVTDILYLISIVGFLWGLKKLSSPISATRGNQYAMAGMGIGVLVATFAPLENSFNNYLWIIIPMILGSIIGYYSAIKVKMTAMPEMVSLFNGLGGACSMFIALVEFLKYPDNTSPATTQILTTSFASIIGSVSFTGSIIAWGKLNGSLRDSFKLPAPIFVNLALLIGLLGLTAYLMLQPTLNYTLVFLQVGLSLIYGITFVTPIGGGDMPVVISLLNSLTGVAAALAGLISKEISYIMVVGGILVGASGTILTILMCKAMNRSLLNVIIGGFGGNGNSISSRQGSVRETTPSDAAIMLKYAKKVIIVPGYGLAVAQAQHICHEIEEALTAEGVVVKYAIHPVAGRMPGHMNVLLAEADVSYDNLLELEDANKEFPTTDVVVVVGANDVVNPAAKEDKNSPIYGMPILDVELAQNIIVLKRSMSTGYAGIENPLFYGEKTKMLFGDAKSSLSKLLEEIANA
ncbi:MAG: NAD(P)(+) transhydrogenase (Re/Si-specific) subunit beta [Cytophagales bacterium]|nr:NAD(P)(+) transhydrogenase (Re/Si-specific) subunit beta [Cytophagales bacterium]MDW8384759.1 NAD(P)(+) transhydrogenase (Re/Si-specific) subunit beta [Flammeovirgaceae bacterium]